MNAAFGGADFLAGKLATGLVPATATRWRTFSTLPPALWVLASTRGDAGASVRRACLQAEATLCSESTDVESKGSWKNHGRGDHRRARDPL